MINKVLKCDYPCNDTNKDMIYPRINIDPTAIEIIMISEAPPADHADYFYQNPDGSFFQTTKTAFQDAGIEINTKV